MSILGGEDGGGDHAPQAAEADAGHDATKLGSLAGDAASATIDGGEPATGSDGGAPSCVPLGMGCEEGSTCCGGSCGAGGNCCNGAGGTCDPTVPFPDADCCLGTICDLAAGSCVAQTCYVTDDTCGFAGSLPCCDPRLTCTAPTCTTPQCAPLEPACCAPDGTVLAPDESSLCCSHGITTNSDGSITCISSP